MLDEVEALARAGQGVCERRDGNKQEDAALCQAFPGRSQQVGRSPGRAFRGQGGRWSGAGCVPPCLGASVLLTGPRRRSHLSLRHCPRGSRRRHTDCQQRQVHL